MTIRLNKLISDAGVCSRREADTFIEEGRVTVNGEQPKFGQKISEEDIVTVDGEKLNVARLIREQEAELREIQEEKELLDMLRSSQSDKKSKHGSSDKEKFGKFNKYAAARKAYKEGGWKAKPKLSDEERLLREAIRPQFGKALRKSAVAQRIAANPKSAALRKTSKNNPINKAKRASFHKKRNQEG